jgi:hypothetical protein
VFDDQAQEVHVGVKPFPVASQKPRRSRR